MKKRERKPFPLDDNDSQQEKNQNDNPHNHHNSKYGAVYGGLVRVIPQMTSNGL